MIISALSSYLADNKKQLTEIVQYYPMIQYMDADGTVKNEIMNRYFLMLDGVKINDEQVEEIK